ncbi:MAG: serine hydrolase domain-containing protein [Flavobacterium sp.]
MLFLMIAAFHVNAQQYNVKIDSLIKKAVKLNRFNGSVLVIKNGKIVFEKGYGYQDAEKKLINTVNTVYQIGSTTKEFTAAAIIKLMEQNKLSLDDKVNKYLPAFPHGEEITIKNLLTHTSGLFELFRDPAFMEADKQQVLSKEKLLSFFIDKPLYFTPGTEYSYCNSGYVLLGLIIEKVTGKPYEKIINEYFLKPLKMKHSGFDFQTVSSNQKAKGYIRFTKNKKESSLPWNHTFTYSAGSLYSTVGDLYLWHKGLLNYKVVTKESLEKITTPFLDGYGFGCWIDIVNGKKIVSHGGNIEGFTSYFGRIQEEDACVILLNNIYNRQIESIGLSIFSILYDKPYSYYDEIQVNKELLTTYMGEYEIKTDYHVKITLDDNRLFIERPNESKTELFGMKENAFFEKEEDVMIYFKKDKDAKIQITITQGLSTKKGDKISK